MGDTGFENLDFLNCCKFAEGDSRILMQKMARDAVRSYSKANKAGKIPTAGKVAELCAFLHKGGQPKWNENFREVYQLAATIIANEISDWMGAKAKL
mmetsp:Transcript_20904/g.29458  ORF Transcript_20904/g.29458 Transcript_20904/m.29458 type:complete len:97 (+) Transcript_20904:137-427(+)